MESGVKLIVLTSPERPVAELLQTKKKRMEHIETKRRDRKRGKEKE